MAEEDIVEEMFNSLIEEDENKDTQEPYQGEINEKTEQTKASEEDAEVAQENATPVGTEEESESAEDTQQDNSEDTGTQQEQVEEAVETKPLARTDFNFSHPRRDLVFLPGAGGNFFATMIYKEVHNMYVGVFNYDPKINEYSVSQNMAHMVINGDAKNNIVSEIKKIPLRLERMRDYIAKLQDIRGHTDYDWMINEINTVLSVSHRLTVPDLNYMAFSDFLISKNDSSFTLEDEKEIMGKNTVGEFYDTLHDLFYEHLNAHAIPYMTDICHVPYHLNTFKPKNVFIKNYSYATILVHEQVLYTTMLMKTKHLLRKKEIGDDDVKQLRHFLDTHLDSKIKTYEYITDKSFTEMYMMGANESDYANHFYYKDMIINPNDDSWAKFYEFFGYNNYYWKNKNEILDLAHEYHNKNIELLLNFATRREIEFMINPLNRIQSV